MKIIRKTRALKYVYFSHNDSAFLKLRSFVSITLNFITQLLNIYKFELGRINHYDVHK